MTNSDFDDLADGPSEGVILLKRALLATGGGLLLIFIAGMIAGYIAVVIEHHALRLTDVTVLSAMVLVAALVAYGMWRAWPRAIEEPLSPRVKSARNILLATTSLSLVLGFVLGLADGGADNILSNGSVSPGLALLAIGVYVLVFALTWLWWQKIDEHEAGAYRDGGLVAVHVYIFVAPIWWMASRAGWLPPQEPMLVLLAVSMVWGVVWFIRRYF